MAFWKSLRFKVGKARQLSPADVFLILEAWLALAFFNLALRRVSLERLQGSLLHHSSARQTLAAGRQAAISAHIVRLTGMAAGLHPWLRMTCLCRALALQWMLSRRGILPVLRLGVLNDGSGIQGHAWLELDGVPLGEAPAILERFSLLT
jgi:hypothetical protein